MALKVPVSLVAEYRGVQAGGDFVNDEGVRVEYSEKLKFEVEDDNGDVTLLPISASALDKCVPPFDWQTLTKGDVVTMSVQVVLGGEGERSYMRPQSVSVGVAV